MLVSRVNCFFVFFFKKGPDIILRCINKCSMRRIEVKVRREVEDETMEEEKKTILI